MYYTNEYLNELSHRRREELLREAENRHLARRLRVARRSTQEQKGMGRLRRTALLFVTAIVAAGILAANLLLALVVAQPAQAAYPGANGKIAFVSDRTTGTGVDNPTGDYEIFTMNKDGTGLTQLTDNTASDDSPSWSADGSGLVFTSVRDGNAEIYSMNADGSNQTRLTNNTTIETVPTISPDESKIAYESYRGGDDEIIVLEGGVETNLTNNATDDRAPAFSSDGSKIAYQRYRGGNNWEIYLMDADGTDQKNISKNPADDLYPDWSPDGKKITFSSNRNGSSDIFVMNALDGSGQKELTKNAASDDYVPAWSPDGKRIAFSRFRGSNYDLFVVNANTREQKRLTTGSVNDVMPDWQPLVN